MTQISLKLAAGAAEPVVFEIPGAEGAFRVQILNEDQEKGVVTTIVHLPPGGSIPAHFHEAGSEMHYVLEGDLTEAGESFGPGGFLTFAAGVVHGPHGSEGGARVLTVQQWQSGRGKFDFHPAEEGQGRATAASTEAEGAAGEAAAGDAAAGASVTDKSAPEAEAERRRGEEKGYG
ncbi:cupin domain-containing protein [Roseomonas gilardii]|uniref:cupin domain-containing protein n=1 Tax=Roseomonas gilardii TaxID=257708 RepID=UPI001643F598|nr:cupin domain-containing protein [Roseomonas gilardii]